MSSDVDCETNSWEKLINDLTSGWKEQVTIQMRQGAF